MGTSTGSYGTAHLAALPPEVKVFFFLPTGFFAAGGGLTLNSVSDSSDEDDDEDDEDEEEDSSSSELEDPESESELELSLV